MPEATLSRCTAKQFKRAFRKSKISWAKTFCLTATSMLSEIIFFASVVHQQKQLTIVETETLLPEKSCQNRSFQSALFLCECASEIQRKTETITCVG